MGNGLKSLLSKADFGGHSEDLVLNGKIIACTVCL